jgi:hypothetical protein
MPGVKSLRVPAGRSRPVLLIGGPKVPSVKNLRLSAGKSLSALLIGVPGC